MFPKFSLTKIIISLALVLAWGIIGGPVQAADLKIKLASQTYRVGDAISVKVILASTDQPANAVSGLLIFPSDKLTISSLDRNGSLINIWTQNPSFSNTSSQVLFEGVILNPGYIGSTGQILTINFKATKAGPVTLTFKSGSVLASDGQGTAILNNLGSASFSIIDRAIIPPLEPKPAPIPTPLIASSTATSSVEEVPLTGFFPEEIEVQTEPAFNIWPWVLVGTLGLFVLILLIILLWLSVSRRDKPIKTNPDSIYYPPATPATAPTGFSASPPPPPVSLAEALVIFSGRAYPANDVSVLLADQVVAQTRTGPDGRFEISFNHLLPGQYNFSLRAFDSLTQQTSTQMFPTTLSAGVTIRNTDIFLVPYRPAQTSSEPEVWARGNNQNVR